MPRRPDLLPAGFSRFHTVEVPAEQRIPMWEQLNARGLIGLRARQLGPAPLSASAVKLSLPRMTLARIRGSAHRVERSDDQIVQSPAGGAVLYFALKGQGRFHHRSGCEVISPGQGVLCDADQAFTRSFSQGLDAMLLTIPREALHASGASYLARPVVFDFRAGPIARTLATTVSGALGGRRLDWDALEDRMLGLVDELLDAAPAAASQAETAQEFIAKHLADRHLSAAGIAAAVGLSPRQLSRVLAEAGTSIPQAVLEHRLLAAQRVLADPARSSAAMGVIAAEVGFGSPEQFSRSYRQRFGVPPLRHRQLMTSGERGRDPGHHGPADALAPTGDAAGPTARRALGRAAGR